MATVPLYEQDIKVYMGKAVDCNSLLNVLSKKAPYYYDCIVTAKLERLYSDMESKYTVFAFGGFACKSIDAAITFCRNTTYKGEVLPLALTSSNKFLLPTMGEDDLMIESYDGQNIYVNKNPVSSAIACKNGIVYIL